MKLILSNNMEKWLDVQAPLTAMSTTARFKYAAKKAGLFFGLALASLFIPVLHFVLVPTFLVVAFYMGYKSMKTKWTLHLPEKRNCVSCSQPLKPVYFLNDDRRVACDHCYCHYALESNDVTN